VGFGHGYSTTGSGDPHSYPEKEDETETIAEEKELIKYQELVRKETKIFLEHKKRISSVLESERPVTTEEQIKLLQDYIKTALVSSEKRE